MSKTRLAPALAILLLALPVGLAHAADWPQFNLDSRHSGWSTQETTIHSGNVSTLHVLYHVTLPSIADGAPALLTGVSTASGVKDLLFLTTKAGHILALDAATGTTIWSKQPATTPNYTTSSPAVDPNRQFVYSYGLDGKVHKYQVGDGTEIMTGGWPQTTTLKPQVEKGSSALSLATAADGTHYLYVANGGYPGDAGDYQGHITAINLATGAQKVFNANCSDQAVHFTTTTPDCSAVQTAIWARPGVVYDPDNDRIFMATGNGNYNGNTGGHNWGDSVFALHPDGSGASGLPVDAYTPTEFQTLQNNDADLGSTAPAILPTPANSNVAHLGVQSGKDAMLRLINLDDLSGMGGPGHLGGELQKISVPQGGGVLTQPAVWVNPLDNQTWVFVANGSGISGLRLSIDGGGVPSLASQWMSGTGGTSPIVVNGMVFYATIGGSLRALEPTTGVQLWTDPSIAGIHWESPIVVNGVLYVTDESSMLWAFVPNAAPLSLNTLTPCRIVDTRQANGPLGGPALAGNGAKRVFALTGACGVPADALALAANVTVISPPAGGTLRVTPTGFASPSTTISF
ncbi:MAG TPA: PQQ-binding-like beta-propeller repeat protein, partial [Thermoanaerobaculia bacterium]